MKLYLLERKADDIGYDECDAMVIRAINPKHARIIANMSTGDEGEIWDDQDKVTCELIKYKGKAGLILTSYRAG